MRRRWPWIASVVVGTLLGCLLLAAPSALDRITTPEESAAQESRSGQGESQPARAVADWRPPAGEGWRPPAGAVFNHPRGATAARWRIVRTVDRAIRNAWPGSTIWIALYMMDSKPSADALVAAHARGVHVRMAVDSEFARSPQMARVARALNADNDAVDPGTGERARDEDGEPPRWGPDESFVTFCRGGCRGGGRTFAHSKFYVFTRTGAARDVVMVGSSNLNRDGAVQGWNDMYVARGRSRLVRDPDAGFAAVHDEMSLDRSVRGERFREVRSGPYTTRFFPTTDGHDPLLRDLRSVRCSGTADGAGEDGHTVVHISTFQWMHDRGIRFARAVAALGRAGCVVRILYGAPGPDPLAILSAAAQQGLIEVWNTRYDKNCDRDPDFRVHHKYLLVSGNYHGDPSSWMVHTGSQNLSRDTTKGPDDVALRVARRDAYEDYLANWTYVRDHYSRPVPHEAICPIR